MKALYMILLLMSMATIFSCNKDEGPDPCEGKQPDEVNCNPNYYWFLANKVGDTIYFKKYIKHTKDTSSIYEYQGLYPFYGADSLIEKEEVKHLVTDLCYDYYYRNEIVITFREPDGNDIISYRLIPNSPNGDNLDVAVKIGRDLRYYTFNSTYYNKSGYSQSFEIGGTRFYDVNQRIGYPKRNTYLNEDTDSTYAFFNRDQGLLKFIIKDSIVYERFIP